MLLRASQKITINKPAARCTPRTLNSCLYFEFSFNFFIHIEDPTAHKNGGLLPTGLPIGTVVKHSPEKYYVKPLIDLNLIDYLQVLLWRADGVSNDDNYKNFRPLNSEESINLLEGVTSRGVID